MTEIGQMFRVGEWTVRPQARAEFVRAWKIAGEWLAERLPESQGAMLLEDTNDPARYLSFAPSVTDPESLNSLMSSPEYQALWAEVMQHCDAVQPNAMRVAAAM